MDVKREDLYQKVWSKPMRQVASEFGLSDVGLAKLCERLEVPRPAQGHWARLANGHRLERTPLLELGSPMWPQRAKARASAERTNAPEAAQPAKESARVEAPSRREAHPAVVRIMDVLKGAPGRDGLHGIACRGQATFRTTEAQKGRALDILDRLCKALASSGIGTAFDPEPNERHRYMLTASDARGAIRISIMERLIQSNHVPTAEEKEREKRYGLGWAPKHDHRPSGLLKLELLSLGYSTSLGRWVETVTKRLDTVLDDIVRRAHARLDEEALRRREAESARKLEAERARLRDLEEARQQHEEALGEDLKAMAESWHDAKAVRAFLDQAQPALEALDTEDRGDRARWIAWAREYADRIDPVKSPHLIAKVLEPGRRS